MSTNPDHGLGRRYAYDGRDKLYSVAARLRPLELSERLYRYWNPAGWWGDQGYLPHCVAFAWTHWLEDGPVTQPGPAPVINPAVLYAEAQRIDEWEGEDYDGTSVRAGAKCLKKAGFVSEYRWATSLEQVVQTLLELGPMVVGTNWYRGMSEPDDAGFMSVDGPNDGGHAWLLNGVNVKKGVIRMKNSWGRNWGNNGMAFVSLEDMARLIAEDGEACIATEVRK